MSGRTARTGRGVRTGRKLRIGLAALLLAAASAGTAACGGGDGAETDAGAPERDAAASTQMLSHRTLGLAYLEENRLEQAEEEFRQLVELAPDEPLGHANLGVALLRQGRYDEAEAEIQRALELAPDDPDIRLTLARLYQETGRTAEARDVLEGTLEESDDHLKSLFTLAESYGSQDPDSALDRRLELLSRVVEQAPGNTAARLERAELLVRAGEAGDAAAELEALRQQVPELPEEGRTYFDESLEAMRDGRADAALRPLLTFRNFFKVTPSFQSDIRDLRGPGDVQAGVPMMTFSSGIEAGGGAGGNVLENMSFRPVASQVGLPSGAAPGASAGRALAAADVDGDGDQDVVTSRGGSGGTGLFLNETGAFSAVPDSARLPGLGPAEAATVGDADNDGHLDLAAGGSDGLRLFRNAGPGPVFEEVTAAAGLEGVDAVRTLTFADVDHDGDLDLHVGRDGADRLFRNDGDGGYTELAETMGLAGPEDAATGSVDFGDFDDDLRLDLVVVRDGAGAVLYRNAGQNRFDRQGSEAGLPEEGSFSVVRTGDVDNDGFLDLFLGSAEGGGRILLGEGDGTFAAATGGGDGGDGGLPDGALSGLAVRDAAFLDMDNDGALDLALAGEPNGAGASGLVLLHGDGEGRFEAVPDLLAEAPGALTALEPADYDGDGDQDLLTVAASGEPGLYRNDGGNANHFFRLRLVGLRTGSGKNNHFGIGAKVEVRAGDLYQMRVVDRPTTHFGLGQHAKAEVVRIRWTNGVPQNLFFPSGDQEFVEEQTLKGSCAFLYTWNGERYEFVKDVMWRSALGMPVGIMAGSGTGGRTYAPPGASEEYVRVPGDALRPRDGRYRLQITEELWEAAYFDQVRLVAVDHPDSVDVFVDERFVPPAPTSLNIESTARVRPPAAATDGQGRDLLPALLERDHDYADRLEPGRYQGITEPHDLILHLGDLSGAEQVRLFLHGWVFPTDASINVAMGQSDALAARPPVVQVPDGDGGWRTVIENLSFPAGKAKTVIADLTGEFPEGDHRVRIRTNLEIYWDQAFVALDSAAGPVRTTTLEPTAADLHHRGFSRLYRKGGRFGPHWFDYRDVTADRPWPRMSGRFTRYGDVLPLLQGADSRYVIMDAGDEVTVDFDASAAPELPEGWSRDFLLYTVGWIKDADLNTATGQTVAPLPFHGMSEYPYGAGEAYPDDSLYRSYREEYNTRLVLPAPSPVRTGAIAPEEREQ